MNMDGTNASQQIDAIIQMHNNWKGQLVAQLRTIILQTNPDITEEIKWKMATRPEGLGVWSHHSIVCFVEIWKDNVKLLFPNGAHLEDTSGIFNARLQSKDIRAIEFRENTVIDTNGITELIQAAINYNLNK